MKRLLLIIAVALTTFAAAAQDKKVTTDLSLFTRFVSRGVNYAESPSAAGGFDYATCKEFGLGADATVTLNGVKEGYGNQLNAHATAKIDDNITVKVQDHFLFAPNDADNDFMFNYGKNTGVGHYFEGTVKYQGKKLGLEADYVFLSTKDGKENVYVEGTYLLQDNLKLSVGYIAGASAYSFYDKGGFTEVGLCATRAAKVSESLSLGLSAKLAVNPNYQWISSYDRVGKQAASLVLGVSF